MCLATLALDHSSARSAELGHSCAWLLCRLAALALGLFVWFYMHACLCTCCCILRGCSLRFLPVFLCALSLISCFFLSLTDTCSLSGNSGTRLLWPPSHSLVFVCLCVPRLGHYPQVPQFLHCSSLGCSGPRPFRFSTVPHIGRSSPRRCRCGSRHPQSVPALDHSCSTASVLGRSLRPVPVLSVALGLAL